MSNQRIPSKAFQTALWTAQVVLTAMFLAAGFMKTTQPIEKLAVMLPWAGEIPVAMVRFIGLGEFLAAIGLLLPSVLRIAPQLTYWAATGIAAIMLLAVIFHIARGEAPVIVVNIVIGSIALFVAWGRARKAPIPSRVS